MTKVISVETSAKTGLLLALASMGVTATKTEDKNGSTEITVDLTDDQVKALEAAFNNSNATIGTIVRDGACKVADVTADAVKVALCDVTLPIASIGIKVAASGARIGVQAVAQTGASVINNLVDEGVKAVAGVKTNDECQKLKQSWATVKGLFAKKAKITIS